MTERDKKTIRFAAIGIVVYLALFFSFRGWKQLGGGQQEYEKLRREALALKQELQPYENKMLLLEKLKGSFKLDPSKLARTSLVAEASAAIHKAATGGRLQLGAIRETGARSTARELTSIQLEGSGPVPAVLGFLQQLPTLGYPLILDAVQMTPDQRPGNLKVSLTIVILDYEQWKEGGPNA